MEFDITILGSNSASFAYGRHQTAQLLVHNHHYYLIDCGEGTQLQMQLMGLKGNRINNIFISHLHGDHYLGLMGLISTYHLTGRRAPLTVYGPKGLNEIITIQLRYSETVLQYPLSFVEIDSRAHSPIYENERLEVWTLPLEHRIPCCGFLFKEKEAEESGIPPRSYAFCSDTKYNAGLASLIEGVNLLYHEATFLDELADRAKATFHSTASEAAKIADAAQVGKLLLGHFSSRYKDLQPFLDEAGAIFPNTELAEEGKTIRVPNSLQDLCV